MGINKNMLKRKTNSNLKGFKKMRGAQRRCEDNSQKKNSKNSN